MILYYCRFATRPVLLQLYQTEVGKGARGKGGSSSCATNSRPACEAVGMWPRHHVLVRQSSVSSYPQVPRVLWLVPLARRLSAYRSCSDNP